MSIVVLFRRQTWRAFWIAFRRAPRDSQARVILLRFSLALSLFVLWLAFNAYQFRGFFREFGRVGGLIYLLIAALVIALIAWSAISQRMERRALERTSPVVSPELKRALLREACLLAILLERLGSESYLGKEIPPDVVIVTRRVLLDRLTALGLRDNLEPWLLDLLLAPDGHWTALQRQRAIPALECLAVLRWVLGLGELRSLTLDPKYSVADARSLFEVKEPEKLYVLASWDLRPERDGARQFFQRCWAELVARRAISGAPEQDVERALAVRAEIQSEGYTGDYLVGARTIPELDTELLVLVARRAYTRWQFLLLLVDILSGEKAVEQLRKFLAQYFAPAGIAETLTAEQAE
jgi:hypothetical protein